MLGLGHMQLVFIAEYLSRTEKHWIQHLKRLEEQAEWQGTLERFWEPPPLPPPPPPSPKEDSDPEPPPPPPPSESSSGSARPSSGGPPEPAGERGLVFTVQVNRAS